MAPTRRRVGERSLRVNVVAIAILIAAVAVGVACWKSDQPPARE